MQKLITIMALLITGLSSTLLAQSDPEVEIAEVEERAIQTVNKLKACISTVADKGEDLEERHMAMHDGVLLFFDKTKRIYEISGLNSQNELSWLVEEYFQKLFSRKSYELIKISWANVNTITPLKKLPTQPGDPERWEAMIRIFQAYKGYNEIEGRLQLVYEEITEKDVKIILSKEAGCVQPDGSLGHCWAIRLGDVKTEAIYKD